MQFQKIKPPKITQLHQELLSPGSQLPLFFLDISKNYKSSEQSINKKVPGI
jgi:hypothetical protein